MKIFAIIGIIALVIAGLYILFIVGCAIGMKFLRDKDLI